MEKQPRLKAPTRWSVGDEDTWGPYWDAMFWSADAPGRLISAWENWKLSSTGVEAARALWAYRECLRGVYESVFGADPARWPARHPGVLLRETCTRRYSACLGCQWLGWSGPRSSDYPLLDARRHETSDGEYTGRDVEESR